MATYETGTATGTSDLIGKLATFAQSLGWTVSSTSSANLSIWPQITSTGRVFSKGSLVFGIGWDTDNVFLIGATGVNGANPWNTQTGSACTSGSTYGSRTNGLTGPYQAYHFFGGTSPDYLHIVVETTAGIFRHMQIGELFKAGTYTGGAYASGTYWMTAVLSTTYLANQPDNTYHQVPFDTAPFARESSIWHMRADIDGKTNNWVRPGVDVHGAIRHGNYDSLTESLHERSPSEFNQLTPLVPLYLSVLRPSSLYSLAGYPKDMRFVNMTNFAPGEIITLGADQWQIFPIVAKTATWGATATTPLPSSSGTYGLAYKRN